jgi:hypothetical protein
MSLERASSYMHPLILDPQPSPPGKIRSMRSPGAAVPGLVVVASFSAKVGRPTVVDLADDGFGRCGIW